MTLLVPHPPGVPEPVPSAVSRPFWDGCRRSVLLFQRCAAGHPVFNPAARCRVCMSPELHWEESSGQGTVATWSVVWRPQTPAFATPYAAAVITLDEGYQMIANVVGCDHADVRSGLRVGVEFHPISDAYALAYFSPLPLPLRATGGADEGDATMAGSPERGSRRSSNSKNNES